MSPPTPYQEAPSPTGFRAGKDLSEVRVFALFSSFCYPGPRTSRGKTDALVGVGSKGGSRDEDGPAAGHSRHGAVQIVDFGTGEIAVTGRSSCWEKTKEAKYKFRAAALRHYITPHLVLEMRDRSLARTDGDRMSHVKNSVAVALSSP